MIFMYINDLKSNPSVCLFVCLFPHTVHWNIFDLLGHVHVALNGLLWFLALFTLYFVCIYWEIPE